MFCLKNIVFLTLCILYSHGYILKGYSQDQDRKRVGIFVNSQTFDGLDDQQWQAYQALVQNITLQHPNFEFNSYPIKKVSNDALVLAKAAIDQIQSLVILKRVFNRYIAVSLWDVQNYELMGEGAFESSDNQVLMDDFLDWFKIQDYSLFRKGHVDSELFARQLISKKECDVLKKFSRNATLADDKKTQLSKDCQLKQSFSQLLSGKKEPQKYLAKSPAVIKVTSKQLSSENLQEWQKLVQESTFVQNLGQYDISAVEFNLLCKTDECKRISLNAQIIAYSHLSFRVQYRLSLLILSVLDSAKTTFSQTNFNDGAQATFYNEYNPINAMDLKGTANAPQILAIDPAK